MAKTTTRKRRDGFRGGRGATVHPCDVCGRSTRETDAVSVGSKLCAQCWELAGLENEVSDGYYTAQEAERKALPWIEAVEAKGGNASEWRETFRVPATVVKAAPEPAARAVQVLSVTRYCEGCGAFYQTTSTAAERRCGKCLNTAPIRRADWHCDHPSRHLTDVFIPCQSCHRPARATKAVEDVGPCQCEHSSHFDAGLGHKHGDGVAAYVHQTSWGTFRVCTACHAKGHATDPEGGLHKTTVTPVEPNFGQAHQDWPCDTLSYCYCRTCGRYFRTGGKLTDRCFVCEQHRFGPPAGTVVPGTPDGV